MRGRFVEGVIEDPADTLFGLELAEEWDGTSEVFWEEPGIVEPEEMVRMRVGEGNRMHLPNPLAEELQPHLGTGVDQKVPPGETEQDAAPGPLVPGVVGPADRTVAPQHRDARRCSTPKDDDPPGSHRTLQQTSPP